MAVAILGPAAYRNPATLAQFNAQYGFDKPWYSQYLLWLGHLLQGNLGFSWTLDQSVASLLGQRLPKTIILVGISTILALVIAVPIGLLQAVRRNKPVDYIFTSLSFLFYAAPTFFVGTVLILVFSVKLGWFGPEAPQGGIVVRLHRLARPGAAGGHPRAGDDRAVQPVHALVGAGQHHRGLRAHRAGQGRVAAAGAVAARDAQLADPDRHPARPVHPRHLRPAR